MGAERHRERRASEVDGSRHAEHAAADAVEQGSIEKHQREYQAERRKLREQNVPESQMDELFRREEKWETEFLSAEKYKGHVGAFEGAGYEAKGLYRPEVDCIMFTRNDVGFCDVCTRAIHRMIDMQTK